ncbi:MAG: hypothetical protein ABIO70_04635 [Pseudomonadota bacterium]
MPLPPGGRMLDYVDQTGHFWHYWSFARAVEAGQPLFSSTDIYFPVGADHLLHRGGHLLVFLSWPLTALGASPALASNLLSLLALALTAAAGALLARRWCAQPACMVLGAVGLGLCRPLVVQLRHGQTEEALVGLVVLALLAGEAALRRGGARRLLLAAGLLALCIYANLEFGVFLALLLLPLGVAAPWCAPWVLERRSLGRAVAVAGGAGLLVAPFVIAFWRHTRGALGGVVGYAESAALKDLPYRIQASHGVALTSLSGANTLEPNLAPSLLLLLLAGVGLLLTRHRERWLWGCLALGFTLLALGPELRVDEHALVQAGAPHLPLYWLSRMVPFLARQHFPARFLIVAQIGLVILAAMGAEALLRRFRRRRWALPALGAMALLVGLEQGSGAEDLASFEAPGEPSPATAWLAADDESYAVILVPGFGQADVVHHAAYLQRCLHGHPTFDGMGADFLVPAPLRDLSEREFLLARVRAILLHRRSGPERELTSGLQGAGEEGPVPGELEVLGDLGFRYLVLDRGRIEGTELAALDELLGRWLPPPRTLGEEQIYALPTSDGMPARIVSVEHSRAVLARWLESTAGPTRP